MAFHLHFSNDLERMADRLGDDLVTAGRTLGVFNSQVVISQTEGMKSWLRLRMAERTGVVANLEFLQPKDLVWRLQYYVLDRELMREQLSRDEMCWGLNDLLGDIEFLNRFPRLADYLQGDEIRKVAFAGKLSDLFDQYLIYRWKSILSWNKMTDEELQITDNWQAYLWRKLTSRFGVEGFDRAEMADKLIAALKDVTAADRVRERLPHLHIFGVAIITPFFQRIFHALSQIIDVHLYLVNPAPRQYWLDHASEKRIAFLMQRNAPKDEYQTHPPKGNDLLLNWGRIVGDSFRLLFRDENLVNTCDDSQVTEPDEPQNLLQRIQWFVYHNCPVEEIPQSEYPITQEMIGDGSLTLSGSFTPVREVEALYNYLVDLCCKTEGPPFSARDILVLVPDIDLYAPYIHSVFGTSGHASGIRVPELPYTIADESVAREANLLTTLLRVLEFDGNAFRAEDVLSLLELPLIRRRFRVDDIEAVRDAVRSAEIHFGLTGDGEGENAYLYSWKHGLQRIIYGLCMKVEETFPFQPGDKPVFPLGQAEGAMGLDRVRLAYFVKVLEAKSAVRGQRRTLSGWVEYLREVVEDVILPAGEEQDEDYPGFVRLLEEFAGWQDPGKQQVSFPVFLHQFRSRLESERRMSRFSSRGITFCSLVPMRSIPFRVVAMLGMNFNDFPRNEEPINFSLLANRELGDRNIRENDNHLFLETLLSAKEKLYISYLARSEKDGSVIPPSALVDELIDFVARSCGEDTDDLRKKWVTVHPLHSFSARYDDRTLRNYLRPERFSTGILLEKKPIAGNVPLPDLIEIRKLGEFINNPAKTYVVHNFKAWYREEEELIRDHELFELDRFGQSSIRKELVNDSDDSVDLKGNYLDKWSQLGLVPAGNLGLAELLKAMSAVGYVRAAFQKLIAECPEISVDVHLKVSGIILSGRIGRLYDTGAQRLLVAICTGSGDQKYFLNAFTEWLCLRATGVEADLRFINRKGYEYSISHDLVSGEAALAWLQDWVAMYAEGCNAMIPFYPPLLDMAMEEDNTMEDLLSGLEEAVEAGKYPFNDSYFLLAWKNGFLDSEEKCDALCARSKAFLEPFNKLGSDIVDLLLNKKD